MPDRSHQAPEPLRATVERIEANSRLDASARRLRAIAELAPTRVRRATRPRGSWLGHRGASVVDRSPVGLLAVGRGSRPLRRQGVTSGRNDSSDSGCWQSRRRSRPDSRSTHARRHAMRRVGAVHAAGNGIVAMCYLSSWRARRRRRHATGVMWGLVGGILAIATGYLGGHLSFGRGIGVGERLVASTGGNESDAPETGNLPEAPSVSFLDGSDHNPSGCSWSSGWRSLLGGRRHRSGRCRAVPFADRSARRMEPEGITAGRGTTVFVGLANGAVWHGDVRTGSGEVLVPGVTGRTAVGSSTRRG